jgi:hypothetical protein
MITPISQRKWHWYLDEIHTKIVVEKRPDLGISIEDKHCARLDEETDEARPAYSPVADDGMGFTGSEVHIGLAWCWIGAWMLPSQYNSDVLVWDLLDPATAIPEIDKNYTNQEDRAARAMRTDRRY